MNHYIFDLDDTLILHRNDIHYEWICEDQVLTHYLANCNGSMCIYTNGTYGHARDVLKSMRLDKTFDKIYARDTMAEMKPSVRSAIDVHKGIMTDHDGKFIFFDDLHMNLRTGKMLGWITVWINSKHEVKDKYDYIDYAYPNIIEALKDIQARDIMPSYGSL